MKSLQLKDLRPAKYNPRSITQTQKKRLAKSIDTFGDLSGVVFNIKTKTLISGHQRLDVIKGYSTKIITKPAKDDLGTTALGFIKATKDDKVVRVPIRLVSWDIRKEKLANIAANSLGGDFDNQKLGKLLAELKTEKFSIEHIGFSNAEIDTIIRKSKKQKASEAYSRKLEGPIYKIRGAKPKLSELMDTHKSDELKASILKHNLKPYIKRFLLEAASRHTVFKYDYIAEYYAHASKEIQGLMEDLCLVIVDYNKAIEHGYLKLSQEVMEMANESKKPK